MSIAVKICGIRDKPALQASIEGGARYVGFVFVPRSRRVVTVEQAATILADLPPNVQAVGLFEDPSDDELKRITAKVPLSILQLHAHETPERVTAVRSLTGLKIMKAIPIAAEEDFDTVAAYEATADMLLFDTKIGSQPTGGTGQSFDWSLLKGKTFAKPWMLAGGINIDNLAEAVAITGASIVDLSSGVENASGEKDPKKIKGLLELARKL